MMSEKDKILKELSCIIEKFRRAKEVKEYDSLKFVKTQESLLFDIALIFVMCIGDHNIYDTELLEFIKRQFLVVDDDQERIKRLDLIMEYEQKYTELLNDINTNVYNEEELEEKFETLESYASNIRGNKDLCFHRFYTDVRHIANLHLKNLIGYGNTPKYTLSRFKHLEAFRYLKGNLINTLNASNSVQYELSQREDIDDSVKRAIIQSYKNQEEMAYEEMFGDLLEIECDGDVDIFVR